MVVCLNRQFQDEYYVVTKKDLCHTEVGNHGVKSRLYDDCRIRIYLNVNMRSQMPYVQYYVNDDLGNKHETTP